MAWYNPLSWGRKSAPPRRTRRPLNQGAIPSKLRHLEDEIRDLRLATQSNQAARGKTEVLAESLKGLRRQTPGTIDIGRYNTARGLKADTDYVGPQYDLVEIGKALDTESFFARAVQRHRELILKNGWRIVGRDPERVAYIKRRLWEIMMTTEQTTDEWFREMITNLVTYSNHLIVQKRDETRSGGIRYKWKGKVMLPVSGLYHPDPTTMSVKQTTTGLPTRWRQRVHNASLFSSNRRDTKNEKFFDHRDVIHITLDKRSGWIFGTPYIVPVLDDIRLLRRLEELTDIIAHKHAFPLFIAKVGSEQQPATDVEKDGAIMSEVTLFREQIEDMEFEGGLVVTERHSLELIGAEGVAMDLSPYLEHVERRVLGGIRLSEIDLGRGGTANRNTAQTITQTLIDACTEIQRVVEDAMNWKLFFFLLMEGGFNVRGDRLEEDMVFLDFPPIDTEERRSQENHEMALYQGHLISEEEARRRCGMDPIEDEDRDKMFQEVVEAKTVERETESQKEVAKTAAAARPASTTSSTQASKNSTANKNRPTNQRGTSPSKPRISQDDAVGKLAGKFAGRIDRLWQEDKDISGDSTELWDLWAEGYKRGSGAEEVPAAGFLDFYRRNARVVLKDAHSRGMNTVETSESESPSRAQIRKQSAATMIAGAARYVGFSAYASGFAKGAEDAGKTGIMRINGEKKQVFTFPVSSRDLVTPFDRACPTLEVLEA